MSPLETEIGDPGRYSADPVTLSASHSLRKARSSELKDTEKKRGFAGDVATLKGK